MKTIPACNAAWSGLLDIIDFHHASFILLLVFAVCTTGNSKQCLEMNDALCCWIRYTVNAIFKVLSFI